VWFAVRISKLPVNGRWEATPDQNSRSARLTCSLQIRIEKILDYLPPAAAIRGGIAFFEHEHFEGSERVLARFDLLAEALIPTGVRVAE
jgi:hypothetical protein